MKHNGSLLSLIKNEEHQKKKEYAGYTQAFHI